MRWTRTRRAPWCWPWRCATGARRRRASPRCSPSADETARLAAADPLAEAPDHVRADVPDWAAPSLARSLGADWVAEGRALAARPPLDLRVNTLKADRARALQALARTGAVPTALSPVGLRIAAGTRDSRTPNIQADEAYLRGWVEVQDEGSQIVALLAGAQPGEQLLDLCAGAGGKTLALAAAMRNSGQIFAHDSDRHRLAPIYDRLKRNGARSVQVRPPGPDALADLVGRMDRVVIDAPCTGAGTWRRRPDAKWKLTPAQLAERAAEQAAILAAGARYVKPGGTLAYITCSLLDEENGAQMDRFAAAQPGFTPLAPALAGLAPEAGGRVRPGPQGRVLLTPLRTTTDGFFLALFRRAA